jgi:hypothetical protein
LGLNDTAKQCGGYSSGFKPNTELEKPETAHMPIFAHYSSAGMLPVDITAGSVDFSVRVPLLYRTK